MPGTTNGPSYCIWYHAAHLDRSLGLFARSSKVTHSRRAARALVATALGRKGYVAFERCLRKVLLRACMYARGRNTGSATRHAPRARCAKLLSNVYLGRISPMSTDLNFDESFVLPKTEYLPLIKIFIMRDVSKPAKAVRRFQKSAR